MNSKRMNTKPFHVSRAEFARLIRRTPDYVGRLIAEGLPVMKIGSGRGNRTMLNLAIALPWVLQRKTGTFDQARTKYYEAQATKVEIENRMRAGELIEVAEARADFVAVATNVKARLRMIPTSIADRIVAVAANGPHAVKALLLGEIDEALRALSRTADGPQ